MADISLSTDECDADRAHDYACGHSDREADEGVSESFLTISDFSGVATGENVLISAVDNVANDEVSGDDGDVVGDVSDDSPDAGLDGVS